MADYKIKNLREIEDMAPKFGLAPDLQARFASRELGLNESAVSLQRLAPNATQPFGHRHKQQEELYVVLAGSGRVKLDDDIVGAGLAASRRETANVGIAVNAFHRRRIALVCLALGLLAFPSASAAKGEFDSRVRALRPSVPGLDLKVIEGSKRLRLENKTRATVIVKGYDDEPYLRFRPDGVVERNSLSPATYLNVDRFGLQEPPPRAKAGARPSWTKVAGDGTYTWFDHRIHLTVKSVPRELQNAKRPKKIFDWEVPLTANDRPVQALGTLSWDPTSSSSSSDGGFPGWIAAALGVLALVGVAVLAMLRRRRSSSAAEKPEKEPTREAW